MGAHYTKGFGNWYNKACHLLCQKLESSRGPAKRCLQTNWEKSLTSQFSSLSVGLLFHIINMAEKSSQKAPPRSTITRHISAPTTQLPAILTDYFKPKSRSEIRSTRPELAAELQRHRHKIHPIVRISPSTDYGGFKNGAFPNTYFHYWLLTEKQLDSLAAFYHQDVQSRWSDQYPKRDRKSTRLNSSHWE